MHEELIPKHKFDDNGIARLMLLSEAELEPLLPELLLWLADYNWPVAREVAPVLARFPEKTAPLLEKALAPDGGDDTLKYWIIEKLLPVLSADAQKRLGPCLARIAAEPTVSERYEGVDEAARELMAKTFG